MRGKLASAAAIAAVLSFGAIAEAQDFERVAPKQPAAQQPGAVTPPPPVKVAPPAEIKVLIPSLKGLRFVPAVGWIARNGAHDTGVTAEYLPMLQKPEFKRSFRRSLASR